MPSNRTSNNIDLVPRLYTIFHQIGLLKKPPPKPWELPDFEPLHIDDFDDHGTPNLPPTLDRSILKGRIERRESLYFTSY